MCVFVDRTGSWTLVSEMPEESPEPSVPPESTEDRLRRLELALASMHPANAPDGYAPPVPQPASPGAGVIPLSLMVNAAIDPEGARRRVFRELPVLRELRLVVQLYVDPRYRLSRIAQFGVPLIVILAVLNYTMFTWVFPVIPFLSPITERVLLLMLGGALAVVLHREALRYRNVLDYLARVGR